MSLTATQTARLLVQRLVHHGVHDWVISPGSRSAPIALAAVELAGRVHVRIDERSAAFLALGLGRGDGRPAAVVCSSGTATANYLPAVVEADAAGVPLVVITADRPPEARGTGANQTITQVGLYGDVVRYAVDLDPGDAGAETIVDAAWTAVDHAHGVLHRAPGPVHLNVPLREPLLDEDVHVDAAEPMGARPLHGGRSPGVAPPPRVVSRGEAATAGLDDICGRAVASEIRGLLAAGPALVVVGEGAGADAALVDEATRLGLPVIAEPTSGARVEGALRCGHWLAASGPFLQRHRPTVVVQLGRPVLSRAIGALVAGAAHVITLDPDGRGWDPGRHTTTRLSATFAQLAADLPDGDRRFLDVWRNADATAGRVLDAELDGAAMTEMGTARDLAAAMPDEGQLVVASSLPIRHLNEAMRPRAGLRVIGNRGASGIDGFTSTAIGAAMGYLRGPTAALAGDLSILHDMTGLVVGPDEPLPSLPIVVLNNDGGGIFDLLPYGTRVDPVTFRRLFATPHGIPLEGLALTTGHGHTHLDDPAELSQVLADAWATPGITLVEVRTDTPDETARHRRITDAIAAALTG